MFTADDVFISIKLSDIESNVSNEEIFKMYCKNFKQIDKDFKSEFYDDKKPSCRIYRKSSGKLSYHDFGTGDQLNCYEYVMKKEKCTFGESLKIIANDFNLLKIHNTNRVTQQLILGNERIINILPNIAVNKYTIKIVSRNWILTDYNYWVKPYDATFEWLITYDVLPCSFVYLCRGDRSVVYKSTKDNPIYAYKEYDWETNEFIGYKIYFPLHLNKKRKWLACSNVRRSVDGYHQLPEYGDLLIITKSRKDVISLASSGYNAISFQAETNNIPKGIIKSLKKRFKRIVLLYDNDNAGILAAEKISLEYQLESIIIPLIHNCKDYSELKHLKGFTKAEEILKQILE